jgi:glutamate dehydrogenase (NAD(P)+)
MLSWASARSSSPRLKSVMGCEEVDSKLYKKMVSAYKLVRDTAESYNVDWRTAAYIVALNRLAKTYKERGIFP